ncbi:MAG: ABC transporter permease subunit/CPBP intramembrane protease [Planctomycetota bacterium]|nr:ABC transporter permease subunit/CPBP intramembrane protease [Planctomycetota bacterium]
MTSDLLPIRQRNSGVKNTYRLALKELKEILRDRRTMITLVCMPLLVYPLLSILFQKFYFSVASSDQKVAYEYVFDQQYFDAQGDLVENLDPAQRMSEEQLVRFFIAKFINLGEAFVFPELDFPIADRIAPRTDDNVEPLFVGKSEHRYFTDNNLSTGTPESDLLENRVKSRAVDVGIRVKFFPERRTSIEIIQQKNGISARAATYLRKRIDLTNFVLAKTSLERRNIAWDEARYQTISLEGEATTGAISMANLVPLILILMTMTGAVYPAIDLTAGERERGTLEALIAAPVPRFQVLAAKFIGVLTVAMLTAIVNMVGMFSTLAVFGLLPILFGDQQFSFMAMIQVFALLLLFASFFSSVLLAVTSFARSFKEAQAYIVPLMLVSITPGIISLTPGLELSGVLAVIPLINIVLLAREIMEGSAVALPAIIAITSTILYGLSALSLAANIFGSDSILYGNQTSWRSLVSRGAEPSNEISIARAMSCLAVIFPLSFLSIGLVGSVPQWVADYRGIEVQQVPYWVNLIPFAASTLFVFIVVPFGFLWHGQIRVKESLRFRFGSFAGYFAAVVIGICMWPLLGQLVDSINSGFVSVAGDAEETQWKKELLGKARDLVRQWRTVSPVLVILCLSVIPAVCEEIFFRGVLLRSIFPRNKAWVAVLLSSLIFGVFHTLSLTDLSSQKFLPSFLAGIILAWLAIKSGSILPGMLLHILNNGILVSMAYYEDVLVETGWISQDQNGFPAWVLWLCGIGLLFGIGIIKLLQAKDHDETWSLGS